MKNRLRAICDRLPYHPEIAHSSHEKTSHVVRGLADLAALGRRAEKALESLERNGCFEGMAPYLETYGTRIDQRRRPGGTPSKNSSLQESGFV